MLNGGARGTVSIPDTEEANDSIPLSPNIIGAFQRSLRGPLSCFVDHTWTMDRKWTGSAEVRSTMSTTTSPTAAEVSGL